MTGCPICPRPHGTHEDDSYGSCTICREFVPHTDNETRLVEFPCAVVRLAAVRAERDGLVAALTTVQGALNRLWSNGPAIDTIATLGSSWVNPDGDPTLYEQLRDLSRAVDDALATPLAQEPGTGLGTASGRSWTLRAPEPELPDSIPEAGDIPAFEDLDARDWYELYVALRSRGGR